MNLFSKNSPMSIERFQEHWTELIEAPLLANGFQASGKSLYIEKNDSVFALIRLGGKFTVPGTICQTSCFRHVFLRNLKEEKPKKFEKEVFAYPIKCEPSKILSIAKGEWHYTPMNLNYPDERIDFSKRRENLVIADLKRLKSDFIEASESLPRLLTPDVLETQIRENGEDAWIERIWLEDYENLKTEPAD